MGDAPLPGPSLEEFVAIAILEHRNCGLNCICWILRGQPAISEAIKRIGVKPEKTS